MDISALTTHTIGSAEALPAGSAPLTTHAVETHIDPAVADLMRSIAARPLSPSLGGRVSVPVIIELNEAMRAEIHRLIARPEACASFIIEKINQCSTPEAREIFETDVITYLNGNYPPSDNIEFIIQAIVDNRPLMDPRHFIDPAHLVQDSFAAARPFLDDSDE